jgi:predicted dehydrogenase
MDKLRVGMIGAGQIANNHCDGVGKHPGARVVAVADLSQERRKAIREKYTLEADYEKWQDLLADASIDAVAVALPNAFHAPVALAALKAGKHVLLDKPFALNQKEAKAVLAAAQKAGKVFMLGMNQRFTREAQMLRTIVARGDLGEIYHAKAFWLRRSGSPKFGTWFCRKELAGGGCMLDIGVHALDLCLHLMGNFKPVAVSGTTYTKLCNRGIGEGSWGMSDRGEKVFDVDDFATALIKFENGATVQLDASWALHMDAANRNNVQLFGTEAGAGVNPLRVFRYSKEHKGEYESVEPDQVKIAYPHMNRSVNWIDVILGKDKPMCTPDEALAVQKILDAVYESSRSGREVRIN